MNLDKELYYRISLGFDFLLTMVDDDRWIEELNIPEGQKPAENTTQQLLAISLLYSGSSFLGRRDLKIAADKIFNEFTESFFYLNDKKVLFKDNSSFGQWNSVISSILLKKEDTSEAQLFAKTAEETMDHYEDKIDKSPPLHAGLIGLNALQLYRSTKEIKWIKPLKKVLNSLARKTPDFPSASEMWLIVLSADIYAHHLSILSKWSQIIEDIAPAQMTSLMLGNTQQFYLACALVDTKYREMSDNILPYQIKYQQPNGAFINSYASDSIRLDYMTSNLISFMAYLKRDSKSELLGIVL
jgi:hypothetical protein